MAKATTAKQQAIIDQLEGKMPEKKVKRSAKKTPEPRADGTKRYMGLPGTEIVGIGRFPFTTDDPEIMEKIERSRSFKSGHVWIDERTDEENEETERLLKNIPRSQLGKLAAALGQRNFGHLSKLELLEICVKDGASLL